MEDDVAPFDSSVTKQRTEDAIEYDHLNEQFQRNSVNGSGTIKCVSHTEGLTVITCALFIVGEMAGSGVLALPRAVVDSGWTGIGLLVVCCLASLYCGIVLGKCWTILQNRKPLYRLHVRDPYPSIGWECYGRPGKIIVEFCLIITLIGVCTVFLLLASQNISSLINRNIGSFTPKNEFRLWLLICSACLLPFTYLATPKDFWPFALGAALCTGTACILIIAKSGFDFPSDVSVVPQPTITVKSFFGAFGTIAFSFGGATLFPTYQTDMKDARKFPRAAALAFLIVAAMYIPTSALPFMVYGDNVNDNVLQSIKNQGDTSAVRNLAIVAEVLITMHLLFSYVITLNPISQQFEEYFKMPKTFGWKRVFTRTVVLLVILGLAEAVPHFGPILSLIGGSTVTMMAFILPCLFYLQLKRDAPLYIWVLHIEIIIVALVSGGAATYSAISAIKKTFD